MGLAQSCLRPPRTEGFEAIKAGAEGACCTPAQRKGKLCDADVVPPYKEDDASTCVNNISNVDNASKLGTCLVPSTVAPEDAHDAVLDAAQLSCGLTATAATGSLQSTFLSSDGYPHSSWELGPPSTDDEQSRVQVLRALDVLDSVSHGRQQRIDEESDIVLGALMQMFNAITAMLVLFDDTRIIVRNSKGVIKSGEFPYRWSFCAYTLTKNRPQTLVVPDATKDTRFSENPFVRGEPHVRFYCGAPLVSASGHIVGTVCFADNKPRPDFDVSKCYVVNNLAELLVRQLERYRANAGPAGPIDAETTALARVARTIECYEAITGLVDISLPDGWMLMYVNEAWEALCSPWTRKQMVGKPFQRLMMLEEEQQPQHDPVGEQSGVQGQQTSMDASVAAATSPAAEKDLRDFCGDDCQIRQGTAIGGGADDKVATEQLRLEGAEQEGVPAGACSSCNTSGACCASRCLSATSSSGGDGHGIIMSGHEAMHPKLMGMPGGKRRQWLREQERQPAAWREVWQRCAGALRAGEEVELGRARVLLEDGRPSTTVVRVSVRSANCHVLDAAVRMPVGVPHQLGLPASILAAGGDPAAALAERPAANENSQVVKDQVHATPDKLEAAAVAEPTEARAEPFYCIVTLNRIKEDVGSDLSEGEGEESYQPQQLVPVEVAEAAAGDSAGCNVSKGDGNLVASPVVIPSTPSPSTCLHPVGGRTAPAGSAHSDLPSPMTRPSGRAPGVSYCGRPSLDNGSTHASASRRSRCQASIGASLRGSMPSCASQGISNWTYGMEPFPGLKLGHLLGKGGYGRVFAALYKGQKVAAKVVSNEMLKSATCVNGVTLEALLAQEIEHPYIVRTYKCLVRQHGPDAQLSMAGMSAGNNTQGNPSYRTPSERSGASIPYRSTLPPLTPSEVTALPGGPSDGIDSQTAWPRPTYSSQVGPDPAGPIDTATSNMEPQHATGAMVGSAGPTTDRLPNPATVTALTVTPVLAAAAAPAPPALAPEVVPAPVARAAPDDFDSFDVEGEEASGGMIDQLVSGGAPVYVPQLHVAAPSGACCHSQLPPPSAVPDRHSVETASGAVITNPGSTSTANANVEQVVAVLAVTGRVPPRVPPGVTGPADLFSPGAGPINVFSTRTAAVVAAAAAATAVGSGGFAAAAAAASRSGLTPNDTRPEGETWILQEFCGGGTLQDAIDSGRLRTEPSRLRGKPHMAYILLTAQEVASAMACVHSRGYIHGDLSAVNVLLTDAPGSSDPGGTGRGWIAKVSDFGLAKHLPDLNQPYISSAHGVITHCAPEVLKSHTQTQKADCYSFGVLLWQMFTGSRPWANMNRFQIFGTVTSATTPGLRFLPAQQPPPRYCDLTMRCLSYNTATRPTFAEICEELRLMTYEAAVAGEITG